MVKQNSLRIFLIDDQKSVLETHRANIVVNFPDLEILDFVHAQYLQAELELLEAENKLASKINLFLCDANIPGFSGEDPKLDDFTGVLQVIEKHRDQLGDFVFVLASRMVAEPKNPNARRYQFQSSNLEQIKAEHHNQTDISKILKYAKGSLRAEQIKSLITALT